MKWGERDHIRYDMVNLVEHYEHLHGVEIK